MKQKKFEHFLLVIGYSVVMVGGGLSLLAGVGLLVQSIHKWCSSRGEGRHPAAKLEEEQDMKRGAGAPINMATDRANARRHRG